MVVRCFAKRKRLEISTYKINSVFELAEKQLCLQKTNKIPYEEVSDSCMENQDQLVKDGKFLNRKFVAEINRK